MVTYNKEGVAQKDGRLLFSGGPRDRQRKLAEQEAAAIIKKELSGITTDMTAKSVGYSKEQVENLVNKTVEEVSIDLEKKYLEKINNLEKELSHKDAVIIDLNNTINKLNDKIDVRDATLLDLTAKITELSNRPTHVLHSNSTEDLVVEDSSRPSIDKIFIDPTANGGEDKYESHVTSTETKSNKPIVSNSIDKLKQIMGNKIPK